MTSASHTPLLGWSRLFHRPSPVLQPGQPLGLEGRVTEALTSQGLWAIAPLAAPFAFRESWRLRTRAAFQVVSYPGSSCTFKPQEMEGWEHHEPESGFTLELCKQHPGLASLEDAHAKIKGRCCLGLLEWSQNSLHAPQFWFIWQRREEKPSPAAW